MATLAIRAERALLGAMTASPGLAGEPGFVSAANLTVPGHRAAFLAITSLGGTAEPGGAGWRTAIAGAAARYRGGVAPAARLLQLPPAMPGPGQRPEQGR